MVAKTKSFSMSALGFFLITASAWGARITLDNPVEPWYGSVGDYVWFDGAVDWGVGNEQPTRAKVGFYDLVRNKWIYIEHANIVENPPPGDGTGTFEKNVAVPDKRGQCHAYAEAILPNGTVVGESNMNTGQIGD